MGGQGNSVLALRGAAAGAAVLGVFLALGTWDGLYEELGLPQGLPALSTQLGGAAFVGLAYLLWASASRPELAPTAAVAGVVALGGAALITAAWLIFRDSEADLGIDDTGTAILVVIAVVLATLALGLLWVAATNRRR